MTQTSHSTIPLNFKALFMATAMPTLILNPALVIVEANEAYMLTTKRDRDQLIGSNIFDAFPNSPDNENADGLRNLRNSLEHVLHHRVSHKIPELKYSIPVGNSVEGEFEERYWSPTNTPLFDDQGNLAYVIHQAEDITSRVISDAAMRDSERRFRALTNATADVVYRMSPDWKYMHQLDGRGFLKTTTKLAEYHIEEYVYPDDLDLARMAIAEAIRNKAIFELEHRVLRADQGYGWTYSKAVPILDVNGEILEWIGSASNITERKIAEEELREASVRKDEFLAMLAHELRNPLAPINSAAQLLQMTSLNEQLLRQTTKIIERQVAHMTNLVNELLDASRVARGLVKLDKVPLDLRSVITDAVEQVAPLMQSRQHHLQIHLCPKVASLTGDKERLVQVIVNLLHNAAKFTPDGGIIQLKTDVLESQIRIEVNDDGIGMTPATIKHAFELFSQAERSSDRSLGGLGLGLALVRSLVELHGGTVTAQSTGLNTGSTFTVYLPRLQIDPQEQVNSPSTISSSQDAARLRILVVDDNEDAATMVALLLESLGHSVVVEHDSKKALERATQMSPHVCVLDIGLPDMDGNELARHLRTQRETANATLIALTGYGGERDRSRSIASGFNHYFVKPVDIVRLRSVLSEIILDPSTS